MDTITAINTVRDSLRTNLTDPRATAGSNQIRTWIYTDNPEPGSKYPRIQVKKADNPSIILSIGSNYAEREFVFMNLWFYTKDRFKIVVDGVTYQDEQLVEYYLGQIKSTLKAQGSTLFTAGVKGYRAMNSGTWEYDPDTQLHYGVITIRVEFYTGCGS